VTPDGAYENLAPYDLLYVPGGFGTRPLMEDARFIDYLNTWGDERPIASVCTGALLLGRAGYLAGKRGHAPQRLRRAPALAS
jgi:putative intracellular protease/amidase